MYKRYYKRGLDIIVSFLALILFSPLICILAISGCVAMKGNPFFLQYRPGKIGRNGKECIFKLIKFRTMSNKKDNLGNLLADEHRLNKYGKLLRSTSLDELPELINILLGDMSIIGPRPQLVKDLVFMDESVRYRHIVRPGLTGLAQIRGRNNITWEQKFDLDLRYINSGISFFNDFKILIETIGKVVRREDTVRDGTVSDMDYGDWLLLNDRISMQEYEAKIKVAKQMINECR